MKTRISDAVKDLTLRRWLVSVSAVGAAALVWGAVRISGQDDPLLKTEPLTAVIQRTQKEKPTIAKMRAFATQHGLSFKGKHHEIYLSDPRRVEAGRLRTILRQPVA